MSHFTGLKWRDELNSFSNNQNWMKRIIFLKICPRLLKSNDFLEITWLISMYVYKFLTRTTFLTATVYIYIYMYLLYICIEHSIHMILPSINLLTLYRLYQKKVYSWKMFATRASGQNSRKLSVSLESLTPFGTSGTKIFLKSVFCEVGNALL